MTDLTILLAFQTNQSDSISLGMKLFLTYTHVQTSHIMMTVKFSLKREVETHKMVKLQILEKYRVGTDDLT